MMSSDRALNVKFTLIIIIVAFLQNATIEYSSESVCVSVFRVSCFCISVFLRDNSKSNQSMNTKF